MRAESEWNEFETRRGKEDVVLLDVRCSHWVCTEGCSNEQWNRYIGFRTMSAQGEADKVAAAKASNVITGKNDSEYISSI